MYSSIKITTLTYLLKYIFKYVLVNGKYIVTRDCAWEESPNAENPRNGCYNTVIGGINTKVCLCDMENLCNGVSPTYVFSMVFAILLAITIGRL